MFELLYSLGFNMNVIVSLLRRIDRKQDEFMATVKESFTDITTKVNKIFGEQATAIQTGKDKIAQLEAALANRNLTDEEASALEEVKAALQKTDDLIPDELPTEPPAEDDEEPAPAPN